MGMKQKPVMRNFLYTYEGAAKQVIEDVSIQAQ